MSRLPLNLLRPFLQQARALPKAGKTNRAARLRFTKPADPAMKGLFERSRQGGAHLMHHKSATRRNRLRSPALVSRADHKRVESLLAGRGGVKLK